MLNNRKICYVIVIILIAAGVVIVKNKNALLNLLENKKTEVEEIQQSTNDGTILNNENIRKEELLKKYESKTDRKKVNKISEIIKKDSNNAELYFERAKIYVALDEWEKAYNDYTKAISIDGKIAKYYIGRAWTYDSSNSVKAEEDIGRAKELLNSDADKLFLTKYYVYSENYDMALEEIKKIKNQNLDYYDELLYIYDNLDNREELIKISDNYIKKYPQRENGYTYKAGVYIKNGEYDRALKVYNSGIKKIKNSVKLFNAKGNVYCFLEKYNEAIKVLDKSIELPLEDYESGFAYMLRGKAYEKLKNYEEAEKNYLKAIDINISENENYDYRELSLDCYEKLIELYTEYIEIEKAAECEKKKKEIEDYRDILIKKRS